MVVFPIEGTFLTNIIFNPFMPTVAFNICCPRDAVSRTANVGTVGINGLILSRRLPVPHLPLEPLRSAEAVLEGGQAEHGAGHRREPAEPPPCVFALNHLFHS